MTITIDSVLSRELDFFTKQKIISHNAKADINALINVDLIRVELGSSKTFATESARALRVHHGFISKRTSTLDSDLLTILDQSKLRAEYQQYLNPTLKSSDIDDIIRHMYLNLFILVDLYNFGLISNEKFNAHIGIAQQKTGKLNIRSESNGHLLVSNKTSFELTKETTAAFASGYKLEAKNELIFFFLKSGIPLLEIPKSYDIKLLVALMKQIVGLKAMLGLDDFKFNLRLRRIRHFKKSGMYIAYAKTIVIDPRNTKTFIHELGHYLFEENVNFPLKSEIKQQPFPSNSIPKMSKYEIWNKDSETFAINLESNFLEKSFTQHDDGPLF